jgi:hypothetical protein
MNSECKREDFTDENTREMVFLDEALVLQRDGDNDHAIVRTNVPHLVVHHSPSGFEFGYGGSGPADLALNVCQWYLNSIGYEGQKTKCFDGTCWSLAWVLHQEFKWAFVSSASHKGITIPMSEIKKWFELHITEELQCMYSVHVMDEAE